MTDPGGDEERSRRNWLGLASRTALGVSAATLAVPGLRFLIPPPSRHTPEQPRTLVVCDASDLRSGQSRTVTFKARPVIIFRMGQQPPRAFDATCTHLGCTVRFDADRGVLHCACHGAEFDPTTGAPLRGPATRPLARVPTQVRHDRIILGT